MQQGDKKSAANQSICARCNQLVPAGEDAEHNDWHLAQELQTHMNNDSTLTSGTSQQIDSPKESNSNDKSAKRIAGAKHASFQDGPPAYTPHASSASAESAAPIHTNQVKEAAKVRARDEVT